MGIWERGWVYLSQSHPEPCSSLAVSKWGESLLPLPTLARGRECSRRGLFLEVIACSSCLPPGSLHCTLGRLCPPACPAVAVPRPCPQAVSPGRALGPCPRAVSLGHVPGLCPQAVSPGHVPGPGSSPGADTLSAACLTPPCFLAARRTPAFLKVNVCRTLVIFPS